MLIHSVTVGFSSLSCSKLREHFTAPCVRKTSSKVHWYGSDNPRAAQPHAFDEHGAGGEDLLCLLLKGYREKVIEKP